MPQAQTAPESSASSVREIGGSVLPPKPLHIPEPKFTKEARKQKVQGMSTISLIVDTQGNPTNLHVLHSMADTVDYEDRAVALSLDQATLDAVSKYRFASATENGEPVAVELNVEVIFKIF
jgi:periplasmic protein TonB